VLVRGVPATLTLEKREERFNSHAGPLADYFIGTRAQKNINGRRDSEIRISENAPVHGRPGTARVRHVRHKVEKGSRPRIHPPAVQHPKRKPTPRSNKMRSAHRGNQTIKKEGKVRKNGTMKRIK